MKRKLGYFVTGLAFVFAGVTQAAILVHESFSLPNAGGAGTGAGASGPSNNYDMVFNQFTADGWGFIGGAGAVQGSGSSTNTGGNPTAANETLKFDIGSTVDSLNTTYGIGGWSVNNIQLKFVSSNTVQGNSRFGLGSGNFSTYWVANDGWVQSTGTSLDRQLNPVYANNQSELNVWAGASALEDSSIFTVAGSGTVTITRPLAASNQIVSDITSSTLASNRYVSLYMLSPASSSTLGMLIFTGGQGQATPNLSFDVVSVPEPASLSLALIGFGLFRRARLARPTQPQAD